MNHHSSIDANDTISACTTGPDALPTMYCTDFHMRYKKFESVYGDAHQSSSRQVNQGSCRGGSFTCSHLMWWQRQREQELLAETTSPLLASALVLLNPPLSFQLQGVAMFSFVRPPPRFPRFFAGTSVYGMSVTHVDRLRAVGSWFKGKLVRMLALGVGRLFEPQWNRRACHQMMQMNARCRCLGSLWCAHGRHHCTSAFARDDYRNPPRQHTAPRCSARQRCALAAAAAPRLPFHRAPAVAATAQVHFSTHHHQAS